MVVVVVVCLAAKMFSRRLRRINESFEPTGLVVAAVEEAIHVNGHGYADAVAHPGEGS